MSHFLPVLPMWPPHSITCSSGPSISTVEETPDSARFIRPGLAGCQPVAGGVAGSVPGGAAGGVVGGAAVVGGAGGGSHTTFGEPL